MYKRKKPIFAKIEYTCSIFELRHDKTNKVTVRPVKTVQSDQSRYLHEESLGP